MFTAHISRMHQKPEAARRRHVAVMTVAAMAVIVLAWLVTNTLSTPQVASLSPAGVAASVGTSVGTRIARGFDITVIQISRYFAR